MDNTSPVTDNIYLLRHYLTKYEHKMLESTMERQIKWVEKYDPTGRKRLNYSAQIS